MSFLIFLLNYFYILILVHGMMVDIPGEDLMALHVSTVIFYLGQCGADLGLEGKEEIVF